MLDFKQSKYDNRDPTLSIQVASDLHIEFYGLSKLKGEELEKEKERVFSMLLTPSAPYLALLGDIGLPAAEEAGQSYRDLLAWCSQRWKVIISFQFQHFKCVNIQLETGSLGIGR